MSRGGKCPSSPDGAHHKPSTCHCYILGLEPAEDCPQHGFIDYRKCEYCQRYMKREQASNEINTVEELK